MRFFPFFQGLVFLFGLAELCFLFDWLHVDDEGVN
jgi:hypothetical protein